MHTVAHPEILAYRERYYGQWLAGLGIIGLILLFALAALVRVPLIYDEAPYLKPIALLDQYGLSIKFFLEYPEPAGLLHNIIHWLLAPITGLAPPLIRLVNPIFLILTIVFITFTLKEVKSTAPLASSLTLMGIPFTWVISGMVLTELPAILLTSLSIYLVVVAQRRMSMNLAFACILALFGGASLGLAFLSRAMVLVILGALPCLLINNWRRSCAVIIAFTVGTAAIVGPVLLLWQGLVPPHSVVPVAATTFSTDHLALSFAYASVVMLIIAPSWFTLNPWLLAAIFSATFAANALTRMVEIPIMRSLVAQLPASLAASVPVLAGSLMIALAVLFVFSSLKNLYARRSDSIWLFFTAAMLLVIASAGKVVHQYSSRYTAMAIGLMILAGNPYAPLSGPRIIRSFAGMCVGIACLLSYYYLSE